METNKEYLARLLPKLKKEIPSQWRVQSFSKNKPIATVMSYIDQRDLMDVLDAYCEYGWEKNYQEVAGNVFCRIGIHMPDGTVHWRSDCGVESQSDAEKGRASDAAKRAGVNWGVGRFLYDKPIQYIDTDGIKGDADRSEKKGEQTIVYKRFPSVVDKTGKKIWDLTAHINALNPNKPKAPESVSTPEPTPTTGTEKKTPPVQLKWLSAETPTQWTWAITKLKEGVSIDKIKEHYKLRPEHETQLLAESKK